MSSEDIIAAIDSEIARLEQVKDLLCGTQAIKRGPGRPRSTSTSANTAAKPKRRKLSAAARAKIAAAQKARWAKVRATK